LFIAPLRDGGEQGAALRRQVVKLLPPVEVEIGERDGEWELRTAEHANFLKSLISPERRKVSMRMVSIRIR
jgi:hypothetical protein